MACSNLHRTEILLCLLIFNLCQFHAQKYAASVGEQNHSIPVNSSEMAPEESTNEIKKFSLEVVQLSVPVQIKMNDMNDYRQIVLPAYSNTNIQLRNMSRHAKDIGFALIQVHAFEYNVTLSYTNTIIAGRHLTGMNLGLILKNDGSLYAINTNPYQDVWISLVLMLYNKSSPIPGGCNMEFPVDISPVMSLTLNDSLIEVDTPPASVANRFNSSENQCGKIELKYESYYLSMPSYDFSQPTYFKYIERLISYANAKASGRLNNLGSDYSGIKRIYDQQVGRGMIFVTVAIDPVHHGFSAYVPVHTYACQPTDNISGCYEFTVPYRILGLIVTLLIAVDISKNFIPVQVKAFICGGIVGLLVVIKIARIFNIILGLVELSALLFAGFMVCALVFLLMACYLQDAAAIICNIVFGFMISIVLFYNAYGRYPYVSVILLVGAIILGVLYKSLGMLVFTNVILFGPVMLFYGVNALFSARLHYSLRYMIRGMWQKNYTAVQFDSTLDTNEIMSLVVFGVILAVCVYVRVRCNPHGDQMTHLGFGLPCVDRGSTASLAFMADDALAYESVSDHPTITRWTSGDDDVFESPRTNSRFFERLRRRQ